MSSRWQCLPGRMLNQPVRVRPHCQNHESKMLRPLWLPIDFLYEQHSADALGFKKKNKVFKFLMTPLKVVDVLGWTLPTYQWGVFKREGTAIPDSCNRSAPPWLALASDFDSPPFAQRRDCTSKRILKKVMRCSRRSAIISHSAMHPADLLSALTFLPIKHKQSCKTNTHPSSGESGSRGSRLWRKRPWHLMAGQEHMPSMSVLTTEGPNEDFIRRYE